MKVTYSSLLKDDLLVDTSQNDGMVDEGYRNGHMRVAMCETSKVMQLA